MGWMLGRSMIIVLRFRYRADRCLEFDVMRSIAYPHNRSNPSPVSRADRWLEVDVMRS